VDLSHLAALPLGTFVAGKRSNPTEDKMAKQVVKMGGEDVLMSENDAKMTRGVRWALYSLMLFILVIGILFLLGVFKLAANNADPSIRNATNASSPAGR
jgi:hypothetical protein